MKPWWLSFLPECKARVPVKWIVEQWTISITANRDILLALRLQKMSTTISQTQIDWVIIIVERINIGNRNGLLIIIKKKIQEKMMMTKSHRGESNKYWMFVCLFVYSSSSWHSSTHYCLSVESKIICQPFTFWRNKWELILLSKKINLGPVQKFAKTSNWNSGSQQNLATENTSR